MVIVSGSIAFAASLASCGAPTTTARPAQKLTERAGVARRCTASTREEDRPFVVTWDATDTSLFESQARRDTVFVRYEGCELRLVRTCRDDRRPGVLGAYGEPTFTSGAVDRIDISDETELYAELPLGVAAFGAHVRQGESLALRYFVSGVAQSTRDAVHEGELGAIAGCAGVTHFVWAFNVGAFELETEEHLSAGASASGLGSEAGGEHRGREHRVAKAGDMAGCATAARDGCRVPIRLVLQRVAPGAAPARSTVVEPSPVPAAPTGLDDFVAWVHRVEAIKAEARGKLDAQDAKACLATLDVDVGFAERIGRGSAQTDMYLFHQAWWIGLRGRCHAALGDCTRAVADAQDAASLQLRAYERTGHRLPADQAAALSAQFERDARTACAAGSR